MVTTIITAMAAYSNERVAAIILSVLYRMLTVILDNKDIRFGFQMYNFKTQGEPNTPSIPAACEACRYNSKLDRHNLKL